MIYGERIRLRHVEKADLPTFVEWLNDPEVIENLMMVLPMSTAEEERWFEKLADQPPEEQPLVIEMKTAQGWRMIGNSAFHKIEWKNRSAEIGIVIGDKSIWNQGYGTEAVRLLLRHGFGTLNLNRIFLRVFEPNKRAIRAYEKAGFVLEGRLRQARYKSGQYQDEFIMGVLRSEWDARHK
jgi:RimJ/RimL family protein N-acetyltransferase